VQSKNNWINGCGDITLFVKREMLSNLHNHIFSVEKQSVQFDLADAAQGHIQNNVQMNGS
jgi:hypothetical protein